MKVIGIYKLPVYSDHNLPNEFIILNTSTHKVSTEGSIYNVPYFVQLSNHLV